MRTRPFWITVAAAVLTVVGALTPADAVTRTWRLSQTKSGRQANAATPATTVPDPSGAKVSADGAWITFSSDASNLASGDSNGAADVFVQELATRRTWRVSVSSSERQANGPSYSPSVSADGRIVAFVSRATNLVAGDSNGVADVFVRDLLAGTTTRVSVTSSGAQATGSSAAPLVSASGRIVAFESWAADLAPGDVNGLSDAFLHDRKTARTSRIASPPDASTDSLTAPPLPRASALNSWTAHPAPTLGGGVVAFVRGITASPAGDPDKPPVPLSLDVYVLNRSTGRADRIPMPNVPGRRWITDVPAISADGGVVAFEGWTVTDRNPVAVREPSDPSDVYVVPLSSGLVEQVSVNTFGLPGNGPSSKPALSADGRYVVLTSDATNLVAGDTNGASDVFLRDRSAKRTSRFSVSSSGGEANGASTGPSISADAREIAFSAVATNIGGGDTNGVSDVFLRTRRWLNTAPDLQPVPGLRTINMTEETQIQLGSTDAENDRRRYGIIAARPRMPRNATVDGATGLFRWTPGPDEGGPWDIVFWVGDSEGAVDIELARFVVRDIGQTVRCRQFRQC